MTKIRKFLMPLACLYGLGVRLRNWLFDVGVLECRSYNIPIIGVGNITVGGTGKTPLVEYLVRLLEPEHRVAVLSRGYRRHTSGYLRADGDSTVADIGDEPWMLKRKFPDVQVAVCGNRREGIERLMNDGETRNTEVILLDDAFQHRYVKPGLNILLTDYGRLITEDRLLPEGRLREPVCGKDRADVVVVTKCPEGMLPIDCRNTEMKLQLKPFQRLFFTRLSYGMLRNMDDGLEMPLTWLRQKGVLLVTGIGNPEQMEQDVRQMSGHVRTMSYADHHTFTKLNIRLMKFRLSMMPEGSIIVTTEKDAARLEAWNLKLESIKHRMWILPVRVEFLQDKELFNKIITGYVQKDFRDC